MTTRPAECDAPRELQRILELEHERNEAHDRARILGALTSALTCITIAREPGEIVAALLQTALDPLGFGRAVYLARHDGDLVARRQVEAFETLAPAGSSDAFFLQSPAEASPAERGAVLLGDAGDLCAPVVDVRGWFVFAELANERGSFGYLYADGHTAIGPRPWERQLIETLAGVTTVALQNALLFNRTRELATRDSLTGLLNRRVFEERVQQEIDACKRHAKSLAIVIIDLDDLKKINDSGGHSLGDQILRGLSAALCASCRSADVVARIAGDEFAMLLVETDADLARQAIRRVSAALRRAGLRCSIGVALYPRDADQTESLMCAADQALYSVKAAGKNGFAFYSTGAPG
jgi:diguanylate cyclase (GGDEF)-like protein